MSLDTATVARIARLAHIDVPEDQLAPLASELSNILGWIEQLSEVDTDDVQPMRKVMDIDQDWRADRVSDGAKAEAVLKNAPSREDHYFVVPRVVE